MSKSEAIDRLVNMAQVSEEDVDRVLEMPIWFGFFGVGSGGAGKEKYAYDVQSNLQRKAHVSTAHG